MHIKAHVLNHTDYQGEKIMPHKYPRAPKKTSYVEDTHEVLVLPV